ncbi:allantoinase AllB [Kribbella sp. NPDC056951]|uniref:allantoinase AllB n=1 Tax=Kribbella sp. NPDC056951 TaxID=3345978 RepID=UPI00362F5812
MTGLDLVIRARRVVRATGEQAGSIGISDGRIVAIAPYDAELVAAAEVRLADDEVLLPGLVDSHVHVNDPGRTAWEGFTSATRAAAAGGVTTIIDMPLNSLPPTCDVPALTLKRETAAPQAFVDIGFWGGAIPGNLAELKPLHEAGVFGFKCFLLHSGVDEFPPLDSAQLEQAMVELSSFDGLLIVHAEDAHSIDHAPPPRGASYRDFLGSRPRAAENQAVAQVIDLAKRTGCRVHILHVSSAEVLPLIAAAKADGVRITAETCPHYLTFAAEEIPDGATQYKCCPPIREASNRDQLWAGLRAGTIDLVVSDHSPSTIDLKHLDTGDFGTAWGGIASLQVGLPAVWTEARRRGFTLADVVGWMSTAPAVQTGLTAKGRIEVGADADLCVLAPDQTFVVHADELHHKNAITPYDGRTLYGVVRGTWLRGVPIDSDPSGRLLTRGEPR